VFAGEGEGAVAAACLAGQLVLSQAPARLATVSVGWQLFTPDGATAVSVLAPALAAADVTLTLGLGPAQVFEPETIACFSASDPWAEVLRAAATFYLRGVSLDWVAFEQPYGAQRVPLPTYPFERERYWINFPQHPSAQHVG
jgi:acyl transferase domain-containing protein